MTGRLRETSIAARCAEPESVWRGCEGIDGRGAWDLVLDELRPPFYLSVVCRGAA